MTFFGCDSRFNEDRKATQADPGADLRELQQQPPIQVPSLISAFGYEPSNDVAAVVAFFSGKRYFASVAHATEGGIYQMEAAVGYYTESNGRIIASRKAKTCMNVARVDGAIVGTDQGPELVLMTSSETLTLPRIETTTHVSSGAVIEWGCFDPTSGEFTQGGWTEVP
jgi:hypothetical protein